MFFRGAFNFAFGTLDPPLSKLREGEMKLQCILMTFKVEQFSGSRQSRGAAIKG